ncbi:hypothetical protein C8A01DRAFT_49577 [Parachaetomium inaequale]|uniref:Cytochrome b561 domain-containing protein n=1 Tax=Parachaetomium inaequale TaxID=2588326 RepID=A0AAN6SMJ0_9PEZI|nr:hypothetical protein C8A01DRAFT_49577 [Parachaetomium inaequale]
MNAILARAALALLGKPAPLLAPPLGGTLAGAVQAQQFGGFNGNGDPSGSASGSGSGSGPSGSSGSPGSGFSSFGANANLAAAARTRATHGILAAVTMVVLFPLGAIMVRVLPAGRIALWTHGLIQMAAVCALVAAAALGVEIVMEVNEGAGDRINLLDDNRVMSHFIIGLVVMTLLLVQPFLAAIHHVEFKETGKRHAASYAHLFNGRVCITLGIANGGLGLWLAGAPDKYKIAYVVAAVATWTLWMLTAVWTERQLWKKSGKTWRRRKLREGDVAF